MAKIDLNLQFLFNEYEILDRYKKSHELGFKFVELQHPYSLDLNLLSSLITDLDMLQVLIHKRQLAHSLAHFLSHGFLQLVIVVEQRALSPLKQ